MKIRCFGLADSAAPLLVLAVCLAVANAGISANAAVVLQHEFAATSSDAPTLDGAAVSTGVFNPTDFKDESGNGIDGQAVANSGGVAVYAHSGGLLPADPAPLPPSWDGRGVRFNGANYVRYDDAVLGNTFAGSFSVFARVHLIGTPTNFENHIFGNGSNNGGWDVQQRFLSVNGVTRLDFVAGGIGIEGISSMPNDQWVDIGMSFSGATGDANPDTVKFYVNGVLAASNTAVANFVANPVGFPFAIGGGHFGGNTRAQAYDRIVIWNEVLGDAQFQALSVIPEPGTACLSFVLMCAAFLIVTRWRAK